MSLFDIDEIIDWIYGITDWINEIRSYMYTHFSNLYNLSYDLSGDVIALTWEISQIPSTVLQAIDNSRDRILSWVNDQYIYPLTSYLSSQLTQIYENLTDIFQEVYLITGDIEDIFSIIDHLDDIIDAQISKAKSQVIGWITDGFVSILETVLDREKD